MSADGTFWAWKQYGLKSSQKFVLLCLGDCHNADTGRCDPSSKFISERTGLDKKTVIKCLEELQELGFLEAEKRAGTSTSYMLNLTQIWVNPKTGIPKNGLTQKRVGGIPKNGSGVYPNLGNEPTKNLQRTSVEEKTRIDFSGIQKLWNEILGDSVGEIRAVCDKRKKHIRARIAEDPKRHNLDWWQTLFLVIHESDFLSGRSGDGKQKWMGFDWVTNQTNMIKIIEGKYNNAD